MSSRGWGVVSVVAATAALTATVGIGQATRPATPGPAATTTGSVVPVVRAGVVCPDLRTDDTRTSRVSVGSTGPAPASTTGPAGVGDSTPLGAPGAPTPLAVTGPGLVQTGVGLGLDDDALVVDARGPLAAGLEVEQVTRGTSGLSRGLAGVRCAAPGTDLWFAGGSTAAGDDLVLALVNTDPAPVLVDVALWSREGPVDGRPGRGLVVPPRGRLLVPVADLAPGRSLLAVRVTATRGRIAAGLLHRSLDGQISRGAEWVPATPPPAARVVLPGLPAGPGARVLVLTNPGTEPSTASVQLTTTDGQFVPPGLEAVAVPGGRSVPVDLTGALAATPAAVAVTATGAPLLAAARVDEGSPTGTGDFAYAGATGPLDGPALLSDLVLDARTESTLLLSAVDGDTSVVVTPVPVVGGAGGLPGPRTVAVPGGSVAQLRLSELLPAGAVRSLAVEVRPAPGAAAVYVARYLRENNATGPLTTLLALQSGVREVPRPAVVADPEAVRTR